MADLTEYEIRKIARMKKVMEGKQVAGSRAFNRTIPENNPEARTKMFEEGPTRAQRAKVTKQGSKNNLEQRAVRKLLLRDEREKSMNRGGGIGASGGGGNSPSIRRSFLDRLKGR